MGACKELNARIQPVRDEMPDASWTEIVYECNARDISLTAHYLQLGSDMGTHVVHGVACAEVEVDILTGNFIYRRVDILEDVGQSFSPLMDVGQVEGGFVMATGIWLWEQLIYSPEGALLTNRTWNYAPAGPQDIPEDFRITFLKDSSNPELPLNAKIVGEPPCCMAVVVVFALRHALISARRYDTAINPWVALEAPFTVEKIFAAANNKIEDYKL